MNFCYINPFVRFAEIIHFKSPGIWRYVRDCRIFYIFSGTAEISIGDQVYSTGPHSVFYCKAGSRYKIKSAGVDLIALDFDLTQEHNSEKTPFSPIRITKDTKLPPCNNTFIDDCDYLNGHLFLPDGMKYDSLLSQIPKEFASRKPLYRENCSALLKTVLVEFIRDCAGATTQTANAVQKIIAYVETNYQQALSNALFSEMTGEHRCENTF